MAALASKDTDGIAAILQDPLFRVLATAYLSKRISTVQPAPAQKDIFENAFNVSGGWDSAECEGHEIYNGAIPESAILQCSSL